MKTIPLFFLLFLALTFANQTYAHAVVTKSTLNVNTVSPEQESQVELTFNSKIELSLSQIILVSAGDKKLSLKTKPGAKSGHIVISLPALSPGEYALQLKIFAADGHLSEDLIRFIVTEENR
jgi:methionine-rich copper-binding protein CopC